mmetsp:Transcript_4762/g.9098  ORF Transcript_4762/g.9098 Transcript_4762/m.9098 type:complete len:927 (+) Transcript_4762:529-3309(+)|eukprot:CAMPEP_0176481890 /NCGR_PEP_ID=MMETSP0200_2-20121128/3077_1 /TAXON_ID=947934 /ORGANISM="Chaetoceros sp., Strain GSL56" /LENGTH=926 /DNA_ID=CAMNT_0017878157 /DNA_START=479 /DNA_END=3259 /DNA_ORIENTATION=-
MRMLHRYYYTSNANNDSPHLRNSLGTVSTIRTLPCINEKPSSLTLRYSKQAKKLDRIAPTKELIVDNPPPASIFACDESKERSEILHHADDSDTCSEMTLSATFSNSSGVFGAGGSERDGVTNSLVDKDDASPNGKTVKDAGTMEWRNRRGEKYWKSNRLEQRNAGALHANNHTTTTTTSSAIYMQDHEKCPEFMIVRAKLKSAKSRRSRFTTSASDIGTGSLSLSAGKNGRIMMGGGGATTTRQHVSYMTAADNRSSISSHQDIISNSSFTFTTTTATNSNSSRGNSGSNSISSNRIRKITPESTLSKEIDQGEHCSKATKHLQENDIETKLNVLFATRQKHATAARVIDSTFTSVNANAKATNSDCNTSSSGIVLDCNDGKSMNDMKADFRYKLNAVFSQRLASKSAEHCREIKREMGNNLDQGRDGSDCLVSANHDIEQSRIVSNHTTTLCGIESRHDEDAAQDGDEENVRDSEPQPVSYEKYRKMLKLGLPEAAVKHAMTKDGVDPSLLFADNAANKRQCHSDSFNKKDQFRRIRLHWDTIPEESVNQGCIWYEIALDTDIGNLKIEEQEFNRLFQCQVLSPSVISPRNDCSNERAVKVIDPKRANNGGIILARLKMSYDDIAKGVAMMNDSILTPQQIIGIMEFIPTEEERKLLGNYIKSGKDSSALCECEKFMLAIMPVQAAKKKLEAILFKLQYPNSVMQLYQDIETLSKACDNILESVKLRKILGVILKVGNRLNLAGMEGIKTSASGFTIELLTKLSQVRALDRRTSILQYIVSVISRWNAPLLQIKDDLKHVLRTKKIADYESSLSSLENQLNILVRTAAASVHSDDETCADTGADPYTIIKQSVVGQFVLDATETISDLQKKHMMFKEKFSEVLVYLAQDETTKPDKLFGAISMFCHELDSALQSNRNKPKYQKM